MENIKVTVYLSTYNQEKYVAKALDSILMQKTDFDFEIIAADDCSTDKTQEIILDYQKNYPDRIITYFPQVNVGGCKKLTDCIDKGLFKGEYLAYLEGDDYWLDENRLQLLTDFLDKNPEYSRVSHKRLVVDEKGNEKGFDISDEILDKKFTINDFLEGRQYSDFGSVFRNYFKLCGSKYNELFLASRNVCDFQSMFITQDFGPVYVLDKCLGVYLSRSAEGETNYNSVTTQIFRIKENIKLAKAVEEFYNGKYDLSPMIMRNKSRLIQTAVSDKSASDFKDAMNLVTDDELKLILPEIIYLVWRGKRRDEMEFIKNQLSGELYRDIKSSAYRYGAKRVLFKLIGKKIQHNDELRGFVVEK